MPGPAPVASDDRQTGVSEGKTDVARRYVPFAARKESAGARPPSTARSKPAGVRPSTTIRTSFLGMSVLRERAQAGVALGGAPAEPCSERREREQLDVAERRHPSECCHAGRCKRNERRRAAARAAAAERAAHDLGRAKRAGETTEHAGGDVTPASGLPAVDRVAEPCTCRERD